MDDDGGIEELPIDSHRVLILARSIRFDSAGTVVLAVIMVLLEGTILVEPDVEVLVSRLTHPFDLVALRSRDVNRILVDGRQIPWIVLDLNRFPLWSFSRRYAHGRLLLWLLS